MEKILHKWNSLCPRCGSRHTSFGFSHSDGEWAERGFDAQECVSRSCGLPCKFWDEWYEMKEIIKGALSK